MKGGNDYRLVLSFSATDEHRWPQIEFKYRRFLSTNLNELREKGGYKEGFILPQGGTENTEVER